MSAYRTVLDLLRRGTSIPRIAERTEMRSDALVAMIESMERAGHLRDISCEGETCSTCPMAEACGVQQDGPANYVITEAGITHLVEHDAIDAGADGTDSIPADGTGSE